ncbi:hypothetical protein BCR33DRAFT_844787 [Rhizoclosmatium globosum]|uniref:Uncharacterized protein n=1 Tax=Rhizoclosmatium globosum TaxID=329046 RepID=A0A1Y2D4F0_9FUNG|nr:hypothetical protein BCR33DRAFT_844787 [Rhizoclosmatium globosum]|eukprot:ORY53465.1 hypothetical protein BCR33DRAFT_844787 [Rhizoclosmatium globosum]
MRSLSALATIVVVAFVGAVTASTPAAHPIPVTIQTDISQSAGIAKRCRRSNIYQADLRPYGANWDDVKGSLLSGDVSVSSNPIGVVAAQLYSTDDATSNDVILILSLPDSFEIQQGVYNFTVYDPVSIDATTILSFQGGREDGVSFVADNSISKIWYSFSHTQSDVFTGTIHVDILTGDSGALPLASFDVDVVQAPTKRDVDSWTLTLFSASAKAAHIGATRTTSSTTSSTSTSTTTDTTTTTTTTTTAYIAQVTSITKTTDIPTNAMSIAAGTPSISLSSGAVSSQKYTYAALLGQVSGGNVTDIADSLTGRFELFLSPEAPVLTFNASSLFHDSASNLAILSVATPSKAPQSPSNFVVYNDEIDTTQVLYSTSTPFGNGFTVSFPVNKDVQSLWYGISVATNASAFSYSFHVDVFSGHQPLGSFDVNPFYFVARKRARGVEVNLFSASSRFSPRIPDIQSTTALPSTVSSVLPSASTAARSSISSVATQSVVLSSATVPGYVPPTASYISPNVQVVPTAYKPGNNNIYASAAEKAAFQTFAVVVALFSLV